MTTHAVLVVGLYELLGNPVIEPPVLISQKYLKQEGHVLFSTIIKSWVPPGIGKLIRC